MAVRMAQGRWMLVVGQRARILHLGLAIVRMAQGRWLVVEQRAPILHLELAIVRMAQRKDLIQSRLRRRWLGQELIQSR